MKSVVVMAIVSTFLSFFGCTNKTAQTQNDLQRAKQIQITGLGEELELLRQNKTEFDFIGITSNGIDCIYFIKDKDKFQIEFEAMVESQIPFINKLEIFASQNGYRTAMTTYGNKPEYNAPEAPVLRIQTNTGLEETMAIGRKIQKEIFNNGEEILYEIVP